MLLREVTQVCRIPSLLCVNSQKSLDKSCIRTYATFRAYVLRLFQTIVALGKTNAPNAATNI